MISPPSFFGCPKGPMRDNPENNRLKSTGELIYLWEMKIIITERTYVNLIFNKIWLGFLVLLWNSKLHRHPFILNYLHDWILNLSSLDQEKDKILIKTFIYLKKKTLNMITIIYYHHVIMTLWGALPRFSWLNFGFSYLGREFWNKQHRFYTGGSQTWAYIRITQKNCDKTDFWVPVSSVSDSMHTGWGPTLHF